MKLFRAANTRAKAEALVAGERGTPIVTRALSMQSRVSNALALGLMAAFGIGALTWYYGAALVRPARARASAQVASAQRVQDEMPLPPLGEIETQTPAPNAARAMATTTASPNAALTDPVLVLPLTAGQPRAIAGTASGPAASGSALKTGRPKGRRLLDRQLGGVVFAGAAAGVAVPSGLNGAGGLARVRDGQASSGAVAGSGALDALLQPGVTQTVQAHVLPTRRLLLPKGAFIDCTLETAIDSTLPGMTTCITATDTFGADGDVVLLERGTKLVGETRGQVQQGAARVFVAWTEARTPTGVIVPLASPGTDELGRAGLPGSVNRHFWDRFGAAMLISVIDGAVQSAVQSSAGRGGPIILNPSTSQDVLTEVLKGTINIAPSVIKRNGDRIQVLVARDVDFTRVYELRHVAARR